MPSTLTGNGASATQSTSPTVTAPSDGDALNVASVNTPFQTLLNHIAKLWAGIFTGGPALTATASGGVRGALNLVPQAAPSAPADGDVWIETTSNVAKARINGATRTVLVDTLTRSQLPTVGQQISGSSGAFSSAITSMTDVTNLSVSITTTGRPVVLMCITDGTGASFIGVGANGGTATIQWVRSGTGLGTQQIGEGTQTFALSVPPGALNLIDAPAAGTYTYKIQAAIGNGTQAVNVNNCKIAVFEL